MQANRWLKQHSGLKGERLAQQVNQQPWNPSVRALTQLPAALKNLDTNLSWTSSLGDAYVNQPQDVLNAVQALRQQASEAGNLQSTSQERVTTQGETIVIQPANPQIVYVPTYNPWEAYGYPIAAYPGWDYVGGPYIERPGIFFGAGFGVGLFTGYGWGWNHWGADWRHHHVIYNHNTYINHSNTFVRRNTFYHGNTTTNNYGNTRNNSGNVRNNYGGSRPGGAAGVLRPSIVPRPYNAPHFSNGGRPGAFSGFNQGGTVQGYSTRGQTSLGGSGVGGSPRNSGAPNGGPPRGGGGSAPRGGSSGGGGSAPRGGSGGGGGSHSGGGHR